MGEDDLKAIRRLLEMFWLVAKWAMILAVAALVFVFINRQIQKQDRMSDILENGTDKPIK